MSLFHRVFAMFLVLGLCIVGGVCSAQTTSPVSQPVSLKAADYSGIAEVFEAERSAGRISGAVSLLANQNEILNLTTVGLADLEAERKMTEETLFCIASMTKPITATAFMMLVEEGKVSVDDPVSKYIPEFADIKLTSGETPEPVTIKHCLTHTSGLYGDQRVVGSLEEHMKVLVERGLAFPPGEKWQYSPGLNVCGRIIEIVSGEPYHEFLEQRIFGPLEMKDTTFFPTPAQQKRLAHVYQPGETEGTLALGEHWLTDFSDERVANPSGGLVSKAADLAKFYQCVLNGGTLGDTTILSEPTVRQMTTLQTGKIETGFTPGNGWGLGWIVTREPQGVTAMLSPGTFGHGGLFGTQGWIDPKRNIIFVMLIQRQGFGSGDASELRKDFQQAAVDALK
ncbi:MAG: beta-lactamase family protein [Planctomycetaceae bacterium]|nr:beta-lactamase family protein [Planctomycetaceae bacterium]